VWTREKHDIDDDVNEAIYVRVCGQLRACFISLLPEIFGAECTNKGTLAPRNFSLERR
jgi:hypothetical protein